MTRCPAALFLRAHDATWRQARDAGGRVTAPHALVWTCARCGRALGVTQGLQVDARRRAIGDEIPVRSRFSGRENAPPRVVALHARQQAR